MKVYWFYYFDPWFRLFFMKELMTRIVKCNRVGLVGTETMIKCMTKITLVGVKHLVMWVMNLEVSSLLVYYRRYYFYYRVKTIRK